MFLTMSLRTRLTLIVLLPLMAISVLIGGWALYTAQQTASEVFDRSLLAAALAVSNDISITGGDALSKPTQDILADTSGGLVYYHVFASDGVPVAGYATPPVGIPSLSTENPSPTYFTARYLGADVIGVRLQMRTEIDGYTGLFTTTVWQEVSVRDAFLQDLQADNLIIIGALIASLACVVWFGIKFGLMPLSGLREAIDERSSDELSPIQRPVPEELRGIVSTLNRLLEQVSRSMTAQSEFVSNAAHQLRNPIAGVLSLAEAVLAAPNEPETKKRARELLISARVAANLSNKLLAIERVKSINTKQFYVTLDIFEALEDWFPGLEKTAEPFATTRLVVQGRRKLIRCDATMLHEALVNLVDNACKHGGNTLSTITVKCTARYDYLHLSVADDGIGIKEAEIPIAVERFSQLSSGSSEGSGLGLTLVKSVAEAHQGSIMLEPLDPGLEVSIKLPLNQETQKKSAQKT